VRLRHSVPGSPRALLDWRSSRVVEQKAGLPCNGTSVWTVRLYNQGAPFYVTVNSYLPTGGAHPVNGAFWVALGEKAFAEANASGWLHSGNPVAGNSYLALDTGSVSTAAAYLSALTGLPSSGWTVLSGGVRTVGPNDVAQELQAGKLVVVCCANPSSSCLVPHHCYNGRSSISKSSCGRDRSLARLVGLTARRRGCLTIDGRATRR
jgi:hypothetical protein